MVDFYIVARLPRNGHEKAGNCGFILISYLSRTEKRGDKEITVAWRGTAVSARSVISDGVSFTRNLSTKIQVVIGTREAIAPKGIHDFREKLFPDTERDALI